jgi:hypothetical protein
MPQEPAAVKQSTVHSHLSESNPVWASREYAQPERSLAHHTIIQSQQIRHVNLLYQPIQGNT